MVYDWTGESVRRRRRKRLAVITVSICVALSIGWMASGLTTHDEQRFHGEQYALRGGIME